MTDGVQEPNGNAIKEAGEIMAEAITHPLGFWIMIFGLVVLMAAYGCLVKNPFWMTRKKLVAEIADAVAERLKS